MATINGVKLKEVKIELNDKGQVKHEGEFVLELGNGIQVGKQSFGGTYGEQYKFEVSPETIQARDKFYESLRKDINTSMGM